MANAGSSTVSLRQYVPAMVEMSPDEARALAVEATGKIQVTPTDDRRRWQLTASNHVGALVCGGRSYLIRPKIPPENVFALLDVGVPDAGWRNELFGYGAAGELLPAAVSWFARLVESTLGRGILRNYRAEEERLVSMRGRVDVAGLMRQPGLALPVPCRFEEFSADIPENRLLKAAIRKVARVPGVPLSDQRRLRRELANLQDVSDVAVDAAHLDRITITRLNQHYRPALRLARLLIENVSLIDRAGEIEAASFLVDMNVVFEQFVTRRLQELLWDRVEVRAQTRVHLGTNKRVLMKPDLEFRRRGRVVYVGDTKYKLTDDAEARSSDYYQLLAYTTALDLDEGVLIYCRDVSGEPEGSVTVRHAGKRLLTYAVDLHGSPPDIEAEVKKLADWVARRATSAPALRDAT